MLSKIEIVRFFSISISMRTLIILVDEDVNLLNY